MTRRAFAVVATGSVLLGCSLLTSLDGLGQNNTDGGGTNDGSGTDGTSQDVIAPGESGTDAGGGGNLIANPSFDDGQGGCGPSWGNGYAMTFTRVSPGRTGPYACEVCIQGSTGSYALDSLVTIPIDAGPYYAEAWLMTPEGGVAEQNGVGVLIGYAIDAGITGCQGVGPSCQGSFSVLPEGTWTKSTALFTANGPGTANLSIHAYGNTPNSCFVVDDVAFFAQ